MFFSYLLAFLGTWKACDSSNDTIAAPYRVKQHVWLLCSRQCLLATSTGGVGFGLVGAIDHLPSRPSLPEIFVFIYANFGLFTPAITTVSVESI